MVRFTLKMILLVVCLFAYLLSLPLLSERMAINILLYRIVVIDPCRDIIKYVMLSVWIPTDNRLYILNTICANYGRVCCV